MEVNSIYLNFYTVLNNFMKENILEVYVSCMSNETSCCSVVVLFSGIFFVLILIK